MLSGAECQCSVPAQNGIFLVFVPKYGYGAITWCDQTAWTAATLYILPMFILTYHHVIRNLKNEENLEKLH